MWRGQLCFPLRTESRDRAILPAFPPPAVSFASPCRSRGHTGHAASYGEVVSICVPTRAMYQLWSQTVLGLNLAFSSEILCTLFYRSDVPSLGLSFLFYKVQKIRIQAPTQTGWVHLFFYLEQNKFSLMISFLLKLQQRFHSRSISWAQDSTDQQCELDLPGWCVTDLVDLGWACSCNRI